jgi:maleylacetate reductase
MGLWELGRRLGAPPSLAAIGLRAADLDRAVALATGAPYPNPRPVTPGAVRRLLADALAGGPPTVQPQSAP